MSKNKEVTAEDFFKDLMKNTGLTKEELIKKLKEFEKQLIKTKQDNEI